ncbi:hypothetical protein ACYTPF_19360, partial [Alteromonas sp. HB246098]
RVGHCQVPLRKTRLTAGFLLSAPEMSSSSIVFKSRKNKLKSFRSEMKTLAKRLDNLLSVALDSDRIDSLLMSMSELGFNDVSQTPLRQENELLGVSIQANLILPS